MSRTIPTRPWMCLLGLLWVVLTAVPVFAQGRVPRLTLGTPRHADLKVTSLSFSPDGKVLACGNFDGTVGLWDAMKNKGIIAWTGHAGPVHSLCFSPDGKTLASGS